jgi:hypothetical protein
VTELLSRGFGSAGSGSWSSADLKHQTPSVDILPVYKSFNVLVILPPHQSPGGNDHYCRCLACGRWRWKERDARRDLRGWDRVRNGMNSSTQGEFPFSLAPGREPGLGRDVTVGWEQLSLNNLITYSHVLPSFCCCCCGWTLLMRCRQCFGTSLFQGFCAPLSFSLPPFNTI